MKTRACLECFAHGCMTHTYTQTQTQTQTHTHTHTHTEKERERESHRESLCNQGNKKYCVMDIRHQQSQ